MSLKIMLDAGHCGNYNQSPVAPEYWESVAMWRLCNYLYRELEGYGFEVYKTRGDINDDLSVYSRGKMARGCDLFLSLHSNACDSEAVNRVDIYAPYDNLNGSHAFAQRLASAIAELMKVSSGNVKTRKSEKGDFDYYGVLRGARDANCPLFCLIEHSFHTNVNAALWLSEDKNLKALAKLEAAVIADYFGIKLRFELGDINMNGEIDASDVTLIKRAYFGTFALSDEQKKLADMNQNGDIDMTDYILAKRKYFNN